MMSPVEQFLASLSPSLRRAELERDRDDLLPQIQRWGAEWSDLCAAAGVPCPPELVIIADHMEQCFVHFRFDGHGWAMLTPAEAREALEWFGRWAEFEPALTRFRAMVPIFGQDGDYLLLAADGAVHRLDHEEPALGRPIAKSFTGFLEQAGLLNSGR